MVSIPGGVRTPDLSQVTFALGRNGPEGVQLLGTCFAVGAHQVATAFHVGGAVDDEMVLVAPRLASLDDYQDMSDLSLRTLPVRLTAPDPIRDLSIYEVPGVTFQFPYGLSGSDNAPPGQPVVTLGFPHANVGRLVLTQQDAKVGARILISNSGQKSKGIVLNTQAREGQSGGPIFNAAMNQVVGVLLGSFAPGGGGGISLGGVDPLTLHQTTHAVSSEYLREML